MTQAAVSHQIKSLEDFLGLKLFRRRNRSLLLTEEARAIFRILKRFFAADRRRRVNCRREARKALTVSLLPSFAIQWLVPRLLSSFNSAYPGIDVRIRAVDRQGRQTGG